MNAMDDHSSKKDTDFVKYRGISQTKSGKWQVRIRNPITKDRIWLGTYNSIKEANDAYSKKKLEFESMAASCSEDSKVKKEEPPNTARKTPGSVYKVRKGNGGWKWRAEIRSKKVRINVGVHATAEEARTALDRKRSELEAMDDPQIKEMPDLKGKSEIHVVKEKMSDVKGKLTGVFRRKSGRWYAEIRNPITKVRGSVGTYETAELAAEALRRKREEFGLMVKDGGVQRSGMKRKTPDVCEKGGEPNRRNPHDVYQRKLEMWYNDVRDVIAKTKSSVGASMIDDENVLAANEDLYVGVIDGYGRLIGEFSRIDDELWLCRSLDDGDDDDDPYRVL